MNDPITLMDIITLMTGYVMGQFAYILYIKWRG